MDALDSLVLAVLDEFGSGHVGVELDLVNGGKSLGRGEELLEVDDVKVGDSDVTSLGLGNLLHLLPGVDEVPVLVGGLDLLVGRVGRAGPVHQVEVDVVGSEVLERVLESLGHPFVVGVVQLGREPDLGSGDARVDDALTDLSLVSVLQRGEADEVSAR